MKKSILILFVCTVITAALTAQEVELSPVEQLEQRTETLEGAVKILQRFKVSGYIQTQYQYCETDADGINFKLAKGRNDYEKTELANFGRFGVRRGRIKFTYTDGIVEGVFQPDFSEKGLSIKDVYLSVKDPWIGTISLKGGIFDRPFGHEIAYSSSRRESPERSRITQSLFPDERDLGAMLTLQADKNSKWNILKLEAGMFAGSGIRPQIANKMDFIGHLSVKKTFGDFEIGGGVSGYLGGVFQGDSSVYVMKDNNFVLSNKTADNIGKSAKRQYLGLDLQFSAMTVAGLTQFRGEYIIGQHPGDKNAAYSFKTEALPNAATYMRKISGGYVMVAQDLGKTPFTIVAKYDWYDPNTEISGNNIANKGEILMSNIGVGVIWRINNALRLTAYYDIVKNEKSDKIKDTKDADGKITAYGYEKDRKDNVLTLRLQYKF